MRYIHLVLIIIFSISKQGFCSDHQNDKSDSVELFVQYDDQAFTESEWIAYYKARFDPSTKPELLRQMNIHPQRDWIIKNFGYVAESTDVAWFESYFHDDQRTFDSFTIFAASALAIMSRRGIQEADRLLDKILTPNFWKDKKINPNDLPRRIRDGGDPRYEMFMCLARIKAQTNDPLRYEKIANALDQVENKELRERIASTTHVANYIHSVPRYAALSDHYVKVVQPANDARIKEIELREREFRKAKRQQREKSSENEESLRDQKKKVGDMYTDRTCYFMEEYPAAVKTALITEADGFLSKIVKPWTRQPSDKKLRNSLLLSMTDDGFPLFHTINMHESEDLDSWASKPKFIGELDNTREVAVDILGLERDLAGAYVFTFAQGPIDKSRGEEIRKAPKSHADAIVVAIPLKNAADLKTKYPKFFQGASTGPFTTLDPNGSPLLHAVYLRDMNKWFWNPPGW